MSIVNVTYDSVTSIVEMEQTSGFATKRQKHPHIICSTSQCGQVGDKWRLKNGKQRCKEGRIEERETSPECETALTL